MDNQNDPTAQPTNQNEALLNPPAEVSAAPVQESQVQPVQEAVVAPQQSAAPVQESQVQPVQEAVVAPQQSAAPVQQAVVNTPPAQQNTANQQAPIVDTAEIPSEWPGAFAGFKQVKPTVKTVALSVFLIYLVYTVINNILASILSKQAIISFIINLILSTLVSGVTLSIYYAVLKHEDTAFGVAFKNATSKFVSLLVVTIAVGFLVFLSILAFIVPFFFIAPRLLFAPFLVMGEGLGIGDSISKSWSMTKGHLGKIYGVYGLMLLICLLFITIIGIPFAIYWSIIAYGLSVQLARFMYAHDGTVAAPQQPQAPAVTPVAPPAVQ
jgi:hypothetical protein